MTKKKKILQPLGTKKITQYLWTKNDTTSQDKKISHKMMQPLGTKKSRTLSGQKISRNLSRQKKSHSQLVQLRLN